MGISWSGGDGADETGAWLDGRTATAPPAAGHGPRVINNHVEVAANTTVYSISGTSVATGHDTNENRGFNQAGFGCLVSVGQHCACRCVLCVAVVVAVVVAVRRWWLW